MNKPDHTVEIVADGPDEQLKELIEWTKTGPERASVSRIEVEDCLPINRFDEFVVEY